MIQTLSDRILPLCGLTGKAVKPPENILNDDEDHSKVTRGVKGVTEATYYHVICPDRAPWDNMEVKDVSP